MDSEVDTYVFEFTKKQKVEDFVATYDICHESMVEFILAKACGTSNRIYMKHQPNSEDFIFVYEYFSKELDITFPLSIFGAQMLTYMNVAPRQLHPNSWTFVKALQILCSQLDIEPTVNKFTYFYQLKHGKLFCGYHLMVLSKDSFLRYTNPFSKTSKTNF